MRHAKRQAMAQKAAQITDQSRGHPVMHRLATLVFICVIIFVGYQAVFHPRTPLPPAWNPTQPLSINDAVTPLTTWKLNNATGNLQSCLSVLNDQASVQVLDNFEASDQCHIRDRVSLRSVGDARIAQLETRCAIALRLAMWEQHSLQPAARDIIGSPLNQITHLGSYSCRKLRTDSGTSTRMSTHATADAIDISGFTFADGHKIRLIDGWNGDKDDQEFLRAARDSACKWFNLTLSPDYNQLHADHFHLQSRGWGLCR